MTGYMALVLRNNVENKLTHYQTTNFTLPN